MKTSKKRWWLAAIGTGVLIILILLVCLLWKPSKGLTIKLANGEEIVSPCGFEQILSSQHKQDELAASVMRKGGQSTRFGGAGSSGRYGVSIDTSSLARNDMIISRLDVEPPTKSTIIKDSDYLPRVFDQLDTTYDASLRAKEICTAVATVYYLKTYQEASEARVPLRGRGDSTQFDRLLHDPFSFYFRVGERDGLNPYKALVSLAEKGANTKYEVDTYGSLTGGEQKLLGEAQKSKIDLFFRIFSNPPGKSSKEEKKGNIKYGTPEHVKSVLQYALSRGFPLIATTEDFQEFSSGESNGCPEYKKRDIVATKAHTVLLIGYDGADFHYLNSYGTCWGESGYGTIHFKSLYKKVRAIYLVIDADRKRFDFGKSLIEAEENGTGESIIRSGKSIELQRTVKGDFPGYESLSVAERFATPEVTYRVVDLKKKFLKTLLENYPQITEVEMDKRTFVGDEYLRALCYSIDLEKGFRTWGLTEKSILRKVPISMEFIFYDQDRNQIATLVLPVESVGGKFDRYKGVENELLYAYTDTVMIGRILPSSELDEGWKIVKDCESLNLRRVQGLAGYNEDDLSDDLIQLKALQSSLVESVSPP